MSIEIQNVSKHFGRFTALDDVSLSVAAGELVALLGPSGCGKTTLLRIIAGLEAADAGRLLFGGRDATRVHARDRRVGFVFQHYALFPHMTVLENIAFGLRVRPRAQRPDESAITAKVRELLTLVQLEHVGQRLPSQLSGGQRQRIALARALAVDPAVLLLDEPFGALDAKVRKELRRWLRKLHDELDVASVFVTHDQDEALEVADRVVVMNRGRIEQIDTPEALRAAPATPFVYGFLGDAIRLEGRARAGQVDLGGLKVHCPEHRGIADGTAVAFIRPHDIDVQRAGGLSREAASRGLTARLQRVVQIGPIARLELSRDDLDDALEVQLPVDKLAELSPHAGETLLLRPRRLKVFVESAAG